MSSKVSRRLSLNSASEKEQAHENSDLVQLESGSKVEDNGTVTKKKDENTKDAESNGGSGEEMSKDNKEPWVNMFKNNRAANNGMQLAYFPPQIVNGEAMVQLERKEVQDEEDKWKCELIAYVVGECPGYNDMNRYIMMNKSKVGKPDIFLHEEGNVEEGVYVSSKVSTRLSLNSASEKEEAHENSDLVQLEAESKVEGNG